jgi:hypothetical protein
MSTPPLTVTSHSPSPLLLGLPPSLDSRIASASKSAFFSHAAAAPSTARPLFSFPPGTARLPFDDAHPCTAGKLPGAPLKDLSSRRRLCFGKSDPTEPLFAEPRPPSDEQPPKKRIALVAATPEPAVDDKVPASPRAAAAAPAPEKDLRPVLKDSPARISREIKDPPRPLKKRARPDSSPAIMKAFGILESGFFKIICTDKKEHEIRFVEAGRGEFNAFCTIFPEQSQVLEERPNEFLGVKIFHPEMRCFDHAMQQRIVDLHTALQAAEILCPQLYNAEEFIEGCGYLLVEYVPLPPGTITPEELLAIAEKAYEKGLFIDLKLDNFRRTSTGALSLVDWGGEMLNEASELNPHFRTLIRNLRLESVARGSRLLSPLLARV